MKQTYFTIRIQDEQLLRRNTKKVARNLLKAAINGGGFTATLWDGDGDCLAHWDADSDKHQTITGSFRHPLGK